MMSTPESGQINRRTKRRSLVEFDEILRTESARLPSGAGDPVELQWNIPAGPGKYHCCAAQAEVLACPVGASHLKTRSVRRSHRGRAARQALDVLGAVCPRAGSRADPVPHLRA